jgi:Fe-S-cluster containining protein
VYVNRRESEELAALLDISDEEFVQKYTFGVKDQNNRVLTSLKSDPTQQQCVFLEGNECSVYDARPTQCRTYPYWPQIMIGQAEWKAEAYNCEGIQIPAKKRAQIDEVALNMIIHQIHDRGAGEDWTYDEARALLEESISEDPNMVEDYLDGFYEETESRLGELSSLILLLF